MVSIYDTDLTGIKQKYDVTNLYLNVTDSLLIQRVNGNLKRLIPLFDYETVENTTATTFKVLNDKSVVVNNSFTGKLLFTSQYNSFREYEPRFKIYLVNTIIIVILSDKYGNLLPYRDIKVYTSSDDEEYNYESTITTDGNAQTSYIINDDEITSIKFEYKGVFSNVFNV